MQNFESFELKSQLLAAIKLLGYEQPTKIQQQAIPHILGSKQDLVALSQTGTGKTAAFGLPILDQIEESEKNIQALILCPTRELCLQIAKDFEKYTQLLPKVKTLAVYGGTPIQAQIKDLQRKPQVVVGTPGRVIDLLNRGKIDFSTIRFLVLDEADEMLNMGFKDDLDIILKGAPVQRQTLLFSATMPKEILAIADNYMQDPAHLEATQKNTTSVDISHFYYAVHARDKYIALRRTVDLNPALYGIVFCRTRAEAKDIASKLMNDGYNADALHGDMSQAQRDYVMDRFRKRNLQLLVATDVAARGIDVKDVSHVIHYNLPDDVEVYVHRSGRTGRAGKKGLSIAIMNNRELHRIRDIRRIAKADLVELPVPNGKEICKAQLMHLVDKVKQAQASQAVAPFIPGILTELAHLEKEQIVERFISVVFNGILEDYKNAPVIHSYRSTAVSARNDNSFKDKRDRVRRPFDKNSDMARISLNIGNSHGLTKRDLMDMINQTPKIKRVDIGKINILNKVSFVEVEKGSEHPIVQFLNEHVYDNVSIFASIENVNHNVTSNRHHAAKKHRI